VRANERGHQLTLKWNTCGCSDVMKPPLSFPFSPSLCFQCVLWSLLLCVAAAHFLSFHQDRIVLWRLWSYVISCLNEGRVNEINFSCPYTGIALTRSSIVGVCVFVCVCLCVSQIAPITHTSAPAGVHCMWSIHPTHKATFVPFKFFNTLNVSPAFFSQSDVITCTCSCVIMHTRPFCFKLVSF